MFSLSRVSEKGVHENRVNGEYTKNTRGGLASLQLRTDVSLLASLYPERADRCPFSFVLLSFFPPSRFSLSLFLSSTCPICPPLSYLPSPFSRCLSISLLLQCTPFFSSSSLSRTHLPAARFCLTYLPLFPLFFPTDCSPTVQPRMSPSISRHSNRSARLVHIPSSILPSFFSSLPRSSFSLVLSSFFRSLPLLRHPTQPAFLSLDLRPSLGEAPSSAARLSSSRRIWTCPFSVSLLFFFSFSLSLSMFRGGSLHSLSFSPFSAVFAPSHDSSRLLSAATAITWLQH